MRTSIIALVAAMGLMSPVVAQAAASDATSSAAAPAAAKAPPTQSLVINLIHLLVEQGVLSADKADALIEQARQEAEAERQKAIEQRKQARAAAANKAAANKATATAAASTAGTATVAVAAATPQDATAKPPLEPPAPGVVRVPYIPEIVKRQIESDVKADVMKTAQAENWAAPNQLPDWVQRIKFNGDFRFRYEVDRFDKSNFGQFVDVNAVNSGNPVDFGSNNNVPFLNTTADRERLRLRARLGLTANVTDNFLAGFRVTTGNTNNPVSTNQTLGTDFSNFTAVIDRAYLRYTPDPSLTLTVGRMDKPFFSTDLVWWDQLGFDGIAGTYRYDGFPDVTPFLTAGAFAVENTAFNFPSTSVSTGKVPSRDKWLYAAQAGVDWKFNEEDRAKFAAAYYDFHNIEGVQAACSLVGVNDPCPTDNTRPGFVQFGNSVAFLRSPLLAAPTGTDPQFIGLSSPFRELNLTGQLDFRTAHDYHLVFDGDFVTNLAFNRNQIAATGPAQPTSGNLGFLLGVGFGTADVRERWDWRVGASYRYIESDALVDAFNDPDFHLGGTNAKGYTLYGALGIAHDVWIQGKLLSATQINGFPYAVDVFQADLNARF